MAEAYVLCQESRLHKNDVKYVQWHTVHSIFSASRDQTARSMHLSMDGSGELEEGLTFQGHTTFVNFVLVHPSVPLLDGEPAVITGSNDKHVVMWSLGHGGIEAVLDAHSDGVRCGTLISSTPTHCADFVTGGWDKICVVWDAVSAKPKQLYTAHQSSVLSMAHLPNTDFIISGSGDKTVHQWSLSKGETVHVYKGHTDSVQAVVAISGSELFASSGNDGIIMVWSTVLKSAVNVFAAHEALVFSLAYHSPTNRLYSASDDHTVRVWKHPESPDCTTAGPTQVILHPATVWSVSVEPVTGDLVTGSGDHVVRVWTEDASRMAPIEKLEAIQIAVETQQIDIKSAVAASQNIPDVASLPDVETMHNIKGNREGEKRFFKSNNVVEVHIWNQGSWTKVGVVVAGPDKTPYQGGPLKKEKQWYKGRQVDYLFDVEIEQNQVKLPYNRGQNIFDAAQDFIFDNAHLGVPQDSKEAIVQHILKLIDPEDAALIGASGGASSNSNDDAAGAFSEFAKEAAAMRAKGVQQAQSWGEAKQHIEASGQDVAFSTFAQEGNALRSATAPKALGAASSSSNASGSDGLEVELFKVCNFAGAKSKVKELINSEDFNSVVDQCASSESLSPQAIEDVLNSLIALHEMLPLGSRFPAVDLVRVLALSVGGASVLLSIGSEFIQQVLQSCTVKDASVQEITVALRLISNLVSHRLALGNEIRCFLAVTFPSMIAVIRHVLKAASMAAGAKAAAGAVLGNVSLLLSTFSSSIAESEVPAAQDVAKAFIAVIAESILFMNLQDPLALKLLHCAVCAKRSPLLGAFIGDLVQKYLGPTMRLMKSSSDAILVSLAQQLQQ